MIVVRLRKPFQVALNFLPYRGFTWLTKVSIPSYSQPSDYSSDFDFSDVNQDAVLNLADVYIDNVQYTSTPSLSSCLALEKGWYFNVSSQELYIHVDHTKRLDGSDFDSLQVRGYTDETVFYDENNICHLPLVDSGTMLSDKVDRLVYEKISFTSSTIKFNNTSGEFDYTFTAPVPGADVNVLFISADDLAEGKTGLTPVYTGYAQSEKISSETYSVKVADKREQLNKTIPNVLFDATTYPNMEDKYIGKLIPEGYGALTGVPAFCTNGDLTSGDVTYKYATDGTVLDTVYVLIDDVWTAKTPTASSSTDCTITLSATDGRESSGRYRKVKVNCTLREEESPVDILVDMIDRYLGYPFNIDYFNISEWGTERALLDDVALYMAKRQEFFKYIESLQNGANLGFIFRIDADGKFTIKVDDITRAVKDDIPYIDNLSDTRKVSSDFTEYATTVIVNYDKDQDEKDYKSVTDETYKEETLDTYRLEKEVEFETLIVDETAAEERAAAVAKDYKKARPEHTITVPGILPQALLDVYTYDSSIYRRGSKIRDYAGTVKIKISSYSYDFANEQTTLTGYDISDIISKGTSTYSEGDMYGEGMYGMYDDAYGPTVIYEPEAG